jgi:hypothetical protein
MAASSPPPFESVPRRSPATPALEAHTSMAAPSLPRPGCMHRRSPLLCDLRATSAWLLPACRATSVWQPQSAPSESPGVVRWPHRRQPASPPAPPPCGPPTLSPRKEPPRGPRPPRPSRGPSLRSGARYARRPLRGPAPGPPGTSRPHPLHASQPKARCRSRAADAAPVPQP